MNTHDAQIGISSFDEWLRRVSLLFCALTATATLAYALLPFPAAHANRPALVAVAALAYAAMLAAAVFPWRRFHRDWYFVAALLALGVTATIVAFSGGWDSPFQSYYYLAATFHAIYHRRRIAVPLNLLTFAVSLIPAWYDPDLGELAEYALVYGVSFFVLSVLVVATMGEVRRRERQVVALMHERHMTEREAAWLVTIQRVDALVESHGDTRAAIRALVGELAASLGYPCVSVHLADDDALVLAAAVGYPDVAARERVAVRGSTIGRVFDSGVSALTRDVSAWGDDRPPLPGMRGTVSVPMREEGRVVGVLTVESRETLDTRDLESLERFAARVGDALTNARRSGEERRRAAREEALREVGLVLAASLDPDAVLDEVLNQLARVLPYDSAAVLTHADDDLLHLAASRGPFAQDATFIARGMDAGHIHSLRRTPHADRAALLPVYHFSEPPEPDENGVAAFPAWIGSLIAAPLVVDDALLGVILVAARERGRYAQAEADLVVDFARHAAMALRNAELHDAVSRSARTDALTGLLNHGATLELLTGEIERAERYGHPLSVLFFDLDHFKAINDEYGHQFGDVLLRTLAALARETVRGADSVGRYGGEEFVAVLPETDYPHALQAAERLRRRIAAQTLPAPADADARITVSVGVTTYPGDGTTLDALIRAADTALYTAKREGRDRVRGFRDVPAPSPSATPATP